MCTAEVEGERKDAAKTVSVKHTEKMLAADGETNTAKCRNKYRNFLHKHTQTQSCRKEQTCLSEGRTRKKGLHVNVSGCELRWMRDGRRLVLRKTSAPIVPHKAPNADAAVA